MTKTQKTAKIAEIQTWLILKGYAKDRFGHYIKDTTDRAGQPIKYRFKFQDTSIRREVWSKEISEWVRLNSGFYKDLSINDKDQLAGLRR